MEYQGRADQTVDGGESGPRRMNVDKHLPMTTGPAGDAAPGPGSALDPVCGMTVDMAGATARDLVSEHAGATYYFCGKGCKLEFGDDPDHFLDPSYVPSM
jgi:Cu+-exporting ATPase